LVRSKAGSDRFDALTHPPRRGAPPSQPRSTSGVVQRDHVRRIGLIGAAFSCEGSIIVAGAAYRYRTWIYLDADGSRIMTDLSEFTPEGWAASIRMGDERA
jgi:hypothetical protein